HRAVDAESLYSRALSQLDEDAQSERMIALRGRGLMRYRMSRRESVDDLTAALELARKLENREAEVEIVLESATMLDWMMEAHRSADLVKEAAALVDKLEA